MLDKDMDYERLITPDYRLLNDNFTEIVIYQLHNFEQIDKTGVAQFAGLDKLKEEAIQRYLDDYVFRNKVKSMVAMLIRAIHEERDNRINGLPFKRFRIEEV